MGIGLFDEGMLEALIEVRDRCLAPGGQILPAKFDFYLEPVQLIKMERIPLIKELRIPGVTFPQPVQAASAYRFRRDLSARCRFLALPAGACVQLRP